MIAGLHERRTAGVFSEALSADSIPRALTRFGGQCVSKPARHTKLFWHRSPGQQCASHGPVSAAVQGWIDNAASLAAELGLAGSDPARVYAAALARWGEEADARCIGNYCAITELADGSLRLARSPWDAPPLYHYRTGACTIASPLLRALFAAGAPRELDYDRIIDELAYDYRDGEEAGWYRKILQVPLGCAITFGPDGRKLNRWYSVDALPQVRLPRDEDYVAAASELLDEAAAKAFASCTNPAMALSGGLDSPLAADALLRAMPDGARLPAITFVPDPRWDGSAPPGTIGDEEALVRDFATFTGRIDPHIADSAKAGFDYRARDMFRAMELYAPGLANVGMMHGVYEKARELGGDMLMVADFGNQSFSDAGHWAYAEYARKGHWRELVQLLGARSGDERSLPRKLTALSILPQLPAPVRKILRRMAHPSRSDMTGLFTLLSPAARRDQAARARQRGSRPAWDDFTFPASRSEASRRYALLANGPAADVHLAFEQLYGLRRRDIAAYRPLIEFCLGLPTRQFALGGVDRRLARRMAKGKMPESHRLEKRHGQHNVDWHARMTPRREELLASAKAMRGHPWLAKTTDIDRMEALIERWPSTAALDWDEGFPRALALPRIALAAQFIGFAEGRNDL